MLEDDLGWVLIVMAVLTYAMISYVGFGKFRTFRVFSLGPEMDSRVVWCIMELPNLIWAVIFIAGQWPFATRNATALLPLNSLATANKILLFMFVYHYVYRTLIYPCRLHRSSKVPVGIGFFAFIFTSLNGFVQSYALSNSENTYPDEWMLDIRFILGSCLWAVGWFINYKSDLILINLRKNDGNESKGKYHVPKGGLFEYVTCAHYFGELLEWTGYAIACWSIWAFAFALYVFCNLAPRAISTRTWYMEKFDNYPKSRKAIIPFLL